MLCRILKTNPWVIIWPLLSGGSTFECYHLSQWLITCKEKLNGNFLQGNLHLLIGWTLLSKATYKFLYIKETLKNCMVMLVRHVRVSEGELLEQICLQVIVEDRHHCFDSTDSLFGHWGTTCENSLDLDCFLSCQCSLDECSGCKAT